MKKIALSILVGLFMIAGPIVSLAGIPQQMKPAMAKSDTTKHMGKKKAWKATKMKKSSKAMKMKKTSKEMGMKKPMKSSKSDTTKMH